MMQDLWEYLVAIMLAVAGGLARLLYRKDKRLLKWWRILSEIFISGFTGLMMLFVLRILNVHDAYVGLFCGLAGWLGPRILDVFVGFGKNIGLDFDEEK